MKFKDTFTGRILETSNDFVITQYKKYAQRYKEIKQKSEKETKK